MADFIHFENAKGPKMFHIGKYSFSSTEIKHLSVALIMITLTLMVHNSGGVAIFGILPFFIIYLSTIGLGFLLHEMGHKLVAQHYHHISEFRADFTMLLFALFLALFSPIIFIAPGAVMIYGNLSRKQNGIVSVAGPLVNLTLAIIFAILGLTISPTAGTLIWYIIWVGLWVNSFLGVFNMLPIWILDGKKVLVWSKKAYFSVLIPLLLLLFFNNLFI